MQELHSNWGFAMRRTARNPCHHPVLAFVLTAILALLAASSLLGVDMVAKSADSMSVVDTSALLPR
jgi:cytochrome b